MRIIMSVAVIVLSGDLLYIFYRGSWYDPIKLIEVAEIVCLWCFIVLAIFHTFREIRCFVGEK